MSYNITHAFLSSQVYSVSRDDVTNGTRFTDPLGNTWLLKSFINESNGYQGGVFVNETSREVVLANRGTEISITNPAETYRDLAADLQMGLGKIPDQFASAKKALDEARDVARQLGQDPSRILITGNRTETFNAYGAGNIAATTSRWVPIGLPRQTSSPPRPRSGVPYANEANRHLWRTVSPR